MKPALHKQVELDALELESTRHVVHVVALKLEYEPGTQPLHDDAPLTAAYRPAAQGGVHPLTVQEARIYPPFIPVFTRYNCRYPVFEVNVFDEW